MRKKSLLLTAAVLTAAWLIFTSCTNEETKESPAAEITESNKKEIDPVIKEGDLPVIDGSTANIPLIAGLYRDAAGIEEEKARSMANVSGGTGEVWRNFMYGSSQLLLVYEAPQAIKEEILANDFKYEIEPIGRDGLVFITHKDNPVESLTTEELIGIYTGEITNWNEVGGEDLPIDPFQRNEESGSQTLFMKLLMSETEPMEAKQEYLVGAMNFLIEAVADYDNSPGAIGFSVYYYADAMIKNPDIKFISVDGIQPSYESIKNQSYPLTNEFYAVIKQSAPQDSSERILRDWLLSPDGTALIEKEGYVPVN